MIQTGNACYKIIACVTLHPKIAGIGCSTPSDGWMIKVGFLTFILEFCQKSKNPV